MRILLLFFCFCLCQNTPSKDRVFILFVNSGDFPKAYYKVDSTTKEKNILGTFTLEKTAEDCSSNDFIFFKYFSSQSIIKVKLDTLQNMLSSKWVATQPDSVLLRLFRHKDVYIIPKDSLNGNIGNAYQTLYRHCETE